jgi:hypothetical protein
VRVNFSLSLNRGREPLASAKKDDVAAHASAAVVRDEALRLVERVGGRAPAGPGEHDRAADAKALAERAMVFRDLANWPEAEALLEASLLVEPDQLETRRQAAIVLGHIAEEHFGRYRRTADECGPASPFTFGRWNIWRPFFARRAT